MWHAPHAQPPRLGRGLHGAVGGLLSGCLLVAVFNRAPGKPGLDQLKRDVVPIKAADSANLAGVFGVCLVAIDDRTLSQLRPKQVSGNPPERLPSLWGVDARHAHLAPRT